MDESTRRSQPEPPEASRLLTAFRARSGATVADADASHVAAILQAMVARAGERWPGIHLDPPVFCDHLAACLDAPSDLPAALAAVHAEDLYLACACAHGIPGAIARFEACFADDIARGLARVRSPGVSVDDVMQSVREKLFTAAAGCHPKIAEYQGLGELRSWVRVVVMRTHLGLERSRQRRRDRDPITPDALLDIPARGVEPELDYLKANYREAFNDAFRQALLGLDARDRNLLRRSLVDRLGVDELGAIHGVHRATAARWVARARSRLLAATRSGLGVRLQVDDDGELDSIMRLLESQLDVSVQRLLASSRGADPEP